MLMAIRIPQPMVYALVGPEKAKFAFHKDLVCAASPYFKAAFGGHFGESISGETTLESTDSKIFGLFNEWLHAGKTNENLYKRPFSSDANF